MPHPLPTIAALWMEGALSYLEQLCLKSFVDAGHKVVLYHYGPLQNVPEGIELGDADEFLPQANFLTHERTGSPALHSDLFRYRMLAKSANTIWADTDAYCLRPFETETGHFYGWESKKHVNGGVLGLPQDSDTLKALLAYTEDDFAIPSWYGPEYQAELEAKRDAGTPVHASEQPWGVWGPHAITHFLGVTGEIRFAFPQEVLYPFSFQDRRFMLRKNFDTTGYITAETRSIHLYGRRMRARLVEKEGGVPHPKSLLGQLLIRHGIDPEKAPLRRREPAPEAPETEAPEIGTPETGTGAGAVSVPAVSAPAAPVTPAGMPLTGKSDFGKADTLTDAATMAPASPASAAAASAAVVAPMVSQGGAVSLTAIADRLGLDRGSQKHRYTELYQMLFLPRRSLPFEMIEICAPEAAGSDPAQMPGLQMWLEFLPLVHLNAIGAAGMAPSSQPRLSYHRAEMGSALDLEALAGDLPAPDVVVDDGSHASHEQQAALIALFPRLKSGGLYIIEDLRWQPEGLERPGITPTAQLFSDYLETRRFSHSDPAVAEAMSVLSQDFSGCFLFQAQYRRSKKDQILVLQKR